MNPLVSVITPVYNGEKYLEESIKSILKQTYKNIEFIIVNDGSTDRTSMILNEYGIRDSRIKIINNVKNMGIIYSLNEAINNSQGKYIARMDADDISFDSRITEQVKFLENNTDIAMCSTYVNFFKEGNKRFYKKFGGYTEPSQIKVQLLFKNYIQHPTVMLRKSILDKYKLEYKKEEKRIEDYGMWFFLAQREKIATLSKVLLNYRFVSTSITSSQTLVKLDEYSRSVKELYKREIGKDFPNFTDRDYDIHIEISLNNNLSFFKFSIQEKENYLIKLIENNKKKNVYDFNILVCEAKKMIKECLVTQGNYLDYKKSKLLENEKCKLINFIKIKILRIVKIYAKKYLR